MKYLKDWKDVPVGLYLIRMLHERSGKHVLHLQLKINDGSWIDQPHTPAYSQDVTDKQFKDFWDWAEANMPIWDYPIPVKSAT